MNWDKEYYGHLVGHDYEVDSEGSLKLSLMLEKFSKSFINI